MLIENNNSIKEGIEKVPVELIEEKQRLENKFYFIIENGFTM